MIILLKGTKNKSIFKKIVSRGNFLVDRNWRIYIRYIVRFSGLTNANRK